MAHTKSAKKRLITDEKRRILNRTKMSQLRSYLKKLKLAAEAGKKEEAAALLPVVFAKIDKAAKANIIHANTAARRKSLAARMVNRIS
ncbi:MAG TPA: 30S ribosomal protein S20 [Planctomycetes bacterium]|nr:30S ribosomal protein S20 [Planctomycetota bacterium]